jgi:hypothetical protein
MRTTPLTSEGNAMKTLLTSAAALALCLTGASAFADHHRDHDGQERLAYDGNLYSNTWNAPYGNGYGYQPFHTNYPLTNGGFSTQPYYGTWNTNYGYSPVYTNPGYQNGCSTCGNGYTNYTSVVQQPQILPGGCVNYNGRVVCPTQQYPTVRPASYNNVNVPRSRLPFTLGGFGGQF